MDTITVVGPLSIGTLMRFEMSHVYKGQQNARISGEKLFCTEVSRGQNFDIINSFRGRFTKRENNTM
jgi:hypothetical protein